MVRPKFRRFSDERLGWLKIPLRVTVPVISLRLRVPFRLINWVVLWNGIVN